MNERIQELKKQAWEYAIAVHDGHIVPPLDKEVWPMDKVFDEKFAELIVRECIDLVEGYTKQRTHTTFYKAEEQIKQHFGVEE